jgi:Cu-Zn family superoxide dismutase
MKAKIVFLVGLIVCFAGLAYAGTSVAVLKGIAPDSKLKGKIKFTEEKGGVVVLGEFSKFPKGKYGVHIHQKGSCDDKGAAAGPHYNPNGNPHGFAPKDFPLHAHPGDMGNITIDEDGNGTLKLHMPEIGMAASSRFDIRKHAVIITEKEDDMSQPDGNGGAAIACGVIEQG